MTIDFVNGIVRVHFHNALNLRLNEWRVLGLAVASNPASFVSVHNALLIDKGLLSRTVRALVDRGFLETRVSDADTRQIELHATPEGSALHDRALAFTAERNAAMTAVLSAEEIALFRQLLDRLVDYNEALLKIREKSR